MLRSGAGERGAESVFVHERFAHGGAQGGALWLSGGPPGTRREVAGGRGGGREDAVEARRQNMELNYGRLCVAWGGGGGGDGGKEVGGGGAGESRCVSAAGECLRGRREASGGSKGQGGDAEAPSGEDSWLELRGGGRGIAPVHSRGQSGLRVMNG